jgi:hypothetical protein
MMQRSLLGRILVVIAVTCGSPAVATSEIPRAVRADLEYLKAFVARDPDKDARSSIGKSNLEFLGVAGYSVMVPSGEEPDIGACLKQADKVKLIRGTSDVIYGDEHMALIQRATRYAARYNALIAKERGLSTTGGCWPSNIGVQRPPEDGRR